MSRSQSQLREHVSQTSKVTGKNESFVVLWVPYVWALMVQ
jgi:hypothetical protein